MNRRQFVARWIGLTLAAWLVIACGAAQPTPTATPTAIPTSTSTPLPTATPTPTPTPAAPSVQEILAAAVDTQKGVESFHFDINATVTVTGGGLDSPLTMPITFVGDFQAPDRMQGSMTTATAQGTPVEAAMIVIGQDVYIKDPSTGQWVATTGSTIPFAPQEFTDIKLSELRGLTLVGEEILNGSPVYHLAGTTALPLGLGATIGEMQGTFQTDYWIDKENSHMLQAAMEGKVPISGTVEATVAMAVTIRFSDFGVAVTIEAPK
jgi:LppX_LprAFG lipoprotein